MKSKWNLQSVFNQVEMKKKTIKTCGILLNLQYLEVNFSSKKLHIWKKKWSQINNLNLYLKKLNPILIKSPRKWGIKGNFSYPIKGTNEQAAAGEKLNLLGKTAVFPLRSRIWKNNVCSHDSIQNYIWSSSQYNKNEKKSTSSPN